ncbi:MAG TPA: MFS transporter [Acidobacteriaceae bacterium]|nr:MFS transporter [Acidobacteriaceae bacterium]
MSSEPHDLTAAASEDSVSGTTPGRGNSELLPGDREVSLEACVLRKISWRILPFVMLLYLVSFLDRVNVGFAALAMNKEIGLTPSMFGLGGGIFFLGYFLFEIPSNLILHRVGARVWIARVMVSWGFVSIATAFVTGPHSFYLLRFLLGLAEAGFFPGIILYLSLWFPARQRAAAIAAFMAAAPLSTAVGSPISGALMEMPALGGLSNWQWLFILEALPAVVLGLAVLKVLTDRPEEASWLTLAERGWLARKLQSERTGNQSQPRHTESVWRALKDPRVLVLSLIYLGTSAGLYTLGLWAPLIIRQFNSSTFKIGLLTAIPSVVAVLSMIAWARHSDRTQERTWHVVIPCAAGCIGMILAAGAHSQVSVILALCIVGFGVNAGKPPLWAMPTLFLSGAGAAAGIAMINSIGNLGGFFGPLAIGWLKQATGSYAGGLYVVAAMLATSAVITVLLSRRRPVAPPA